MEAYQELQIIEQEILNDFQLDQQDNFDRWAE